MKSLIVSAFLLLAIPGVSPGAIQYEFQQSSRTDSNQAPSELSGKAFLDGDRSRIEYTRNSVFPPGSYVLSHLSARTMYVVNPASRSYYDVQLSTVANTLGSGKIEVANLKTSSQKFSDHPLVAGVPTDHQRFESSYEMTVLFGRMPLRQYVQTTIESWTTTAFGSVPAPLFAAAEFTTGNAELDRLIAAETSGINGLALRQIVTITTSAKQAAKPARSAVKLNVSRRQTSEVLVTSVKTVQVDPTFFQIPPGFIKSVPAQVGPDGQPIAPQPAAPGKS